jgi:hypothetical protein
MREFLLFMHGDAVDEAEADWPTYLDGLARGGRLRGGSSLGGGACFRRDGTQRPTSDHLTGFIRVAAESMEDARSCLAGNPVYEAEGTVEIRLLVEDE